MAAPATKLTSVTQRYKIKDLKWERSSAIIGGRLMFCRGRKILGYGSVENLHRVALIPPGADTLVVSAADYDDLKAWIA